MDKAEMKKLLAEGWKKVFDVDKVDKNADFFEAGGDSIKAVQLSAWLIQKGVKLDLADVFMTPKFNDLAEKLAETTPVYVPDAMMTKEIAAKEMGFSSVEEAQAAEKAGMQMGAPMSNQQVCTPMGDQQACTPMGNQQVCTPMGEQQVCTPMGEQQVCTPMGNQQVCTPMGNQQVCTPQVCTPMVCTPMGNQQVCTPQVCTPMGNQQVCTPMGNQQVCTPMGNQQVCTPMGNPDDMVPPQIKKYISKPVDAPIENPNVIKINKMKLGEKTKSAEEVLTDVLKGLLPNFDKTKDLFEQGLTSFDTVKMVTRCGEGGYDLEMKDIYLHSKFDELVKLLK